MNASKALSTVAMASLVQTCLFATVSNPVRMVSDPDNVLQWRTLTADETTLSFDWPDAAAIAEWSVTNIRHRAIGSGTIVRGAGVRTSSFVLSAVVPTNAASESTYDVCVRFKDGSGSALDGATLLASLARVRGVGGAAAEFRNVDSAKWPRACSSAVLPVPAGVQAVAIDGQPVETGLYGAVGWFGWFPIRPGHHELACDGGNPVSVCGAGGFVVIVQ